MVKAISFGVSAAAAKTMPPSFSRCSSSPATALPAEIVSIAAGPGPRTGRSGNVALWIPRESRADGFLLLLVALCYRVDGVELVLGVSVAGRHRPMPGGQGGRDLRVAGQWLAAWFRPFRSALQPATVGIDYTQTREVCQTLRPAR